MNKILVTTNLTRKWKVRRKVVLHVIALYLFITLVASFFLSFPFLSIFSFESIRHGEIIVVSMQYVRRKSQQNGAKKTAACDCFSPLGFSFMFSFHHWRTYHNSFLRGLRLLLPAWLLNPCSRFNVVRTIFRFFFRLDTYDEFLAVCTYHHNNEYSIAEEAKINGAN